MGNCVFPAVRGRGNFSLNGSSALRCRPRTLHHRHSGSFTRPHITVLPALRQFRPATHHRSPGPPAVPPAKHHRSPGPPAVPPATHHRSPGPPAVPPGHFHPHFVRIVRIVRKVRIVLTATAPFKRHSGASIRTLHHRSAENPFNVSHAPRTSCTRKISTPDSARAHNTPMVAKSR